MKYLKLGLLLLVFCLTGCDVNYNLTITNDDMIESVDFWYPNTKENEKILDQYLSVDHQAYFDMDNSINYNYLQKKISNDNKIGMNMEYRYNDDNLQKSSLLNRCYYKKSVINTDDEVIINAEGPISCMYMDDIKQFDSLRININTKLKVIKNNADKVDGNTYTWIINEDNYKSHSILIKMEKIKNGKFNIWIIVVILIILLIFMLIFAYYTYLKNKKRNAL